MRSTPTGATGLALALVSALTFGTSGTFGSSLITAGWSPAAAVTARVSVAAALLTLPAVWQLRGRWGALRRGAGPVTVYGLVAVAGCQLCYFNAVEHLSVGVALLLEYLGTVLVVGWLWLRHGHRPRRLTLAGGAAALVGLALVLDVTGAHRLDLAGVLWGLGAAVGLAVFFVLSAHADAAVPPLAMAWGGLLVGSLGLLALALTGATSLRAPRTDVQLLDHAVSWVVPLLGLSVVAAALAYVTGISAARMLGPKVASFVGLTEVLFAVLFAWLLLGQLPVAVQLVGGLLIVSGVVLVRVDELRAPVAAAGAAVLAPAATG